MHPLGTKDPGWTNERRGPAEVFLGFDARERFVSLDELWTDARRRQFLLRQEVVKPLSVDAWVWPSIFGKGLPLQHASARPVPPDRTGNVAGLWEDLAQMDLYIEQYRALEYSRVAIAMVSEDAGSASRALAPKEAFEGLKRRLLGYDVADEYLLSGLSNCGYAAEEREALVAKWTPRVNEHHLFDDVHHALEFSRVTSTRVPEHAPFFVYALYMLEPPFAVP